MPAYDNPAGRRRYSLWVADRDESGTPVDPQFIRAAYALEASLLRYRQRELGCESLATELIQASVNAASRATRAETVQNPSAYLFAVFKRKVDRYLADQSKEVSVSEGFIDDLSLREQDPRDTAQLFENRVLLLEVKAHMDDWTRRVCDMRIVGFSIPEIARSLGEPVDRVAVRYSRGLRKAVDRLLHSGVDRRKLKPDG